MAEISIDMKADISVDKMVEKDHWKNERTGGC